MEKVQELKRSAMRAVVALSKIPDIGNFCLLELYSCECGIWSVEL